MKNKDSKNELELKKMTLEAWAKLLLREKIIDEAHCSRMITAIAKMKS